MEHYQFDEKLSKKQKQKLTDWLTSYLGWFPLEFVDAEMTEDQVLHKLKTLSHSIADIATIISFQDIISTKRAFPVAQNDAHHRVPINSKIKPICKQQK
jgi:hypothetical protein